MNVRFMYKMAQEFPEIMTPKTKRLIRKELSRGSDPLAKSIREAARVIFHPEGDGCSEYRIYPDHGETDEEIREWVDEMWMRVFSPYDCTGQVFTVDIHWKRVPAGTVMKKRPLLKFQKETGLLPYVGTMAEESAQRTQAWMQTGCNAYEGTHPKSAPLSFWTEQDILQYIVENDLPIASCYGEIKEDENGKLFTTGVHRTGCMFCIFGAHLEKSPNRFERMKETHPKQYDFCMRPLDENGLGLDAVLNYLNIRH